MKEELAECSLDFDEKARFVRPIDYSVMPAERKGSCNPGSYVCDQKELVFAALFTA